MKNYIEEASRTSSKDDKTFEQFIDQRDYDQVRIGFHAVSQSAEKMKKQIFYGRDISKIPSINPLKIINLEDLHANMGIMGEAGELVDADTKEEVLLEAGDLLWYVAKKLRNYDLTFEEVMEANIAKLKKRFPDRFTHDAANNRLAESGDSAIVGPRC